MSNLFLFCFCVFFFVLARSFRRDAVFIGLHLFGLYISKSYHCRSLKMQEKEKTCSCHPSPSPQPWQWCTLVQRQILQSRWNKHSNSQKFPTRFELSVIVSYDLKLKHAILFRDTFTDVVLRVCIIYRFCTVHLKIFSRH